MPIELIIGLVVIAAWRIIAGMRIPVLSTLLRAIWNLCFTVSSFIPFFGWAAHFIIADTAKEKMDKEEMIKVGETDDSLVADAFGGGSVRRLPKPGDLPGTIFINGVTYNRTSGCDDYAFYDSADRTHSVQITSVLSMAYGEADTNVGHISF